MKPFRLSLLSATSPFCVSSNRDGFTQFPPGVLQRVSADIPLRWEGTEK